MNDLDGGVQVLYVGVVDTGQLNGPKAVLAAVNMLFDGQHLMPLLAQTTTHVDVLMTTDGILLIDKLRRCSELPQN